MPESPRARQDSRPAQMRAALAWPGQRTRDSAATSARPSTKAYKLYTENSVAAVSELPRISAFCSCADPAGILPPLLQCGALVHGALHATATEAATGPLEPALDATRGANTCVARRGEAWRGVACGVHKARTRHALAEESLSPLCQGRANLLPFRPFSPMARIAARVAPPSLG